MDENTKAELETILKILRRRRDEYEQKKNRLDASVDEINDFIGIIEKRMD